MSRAMLPSEFDVTETEPRIRDLRLGQSGYVVGWALAFSEYGAGWIRGDYTVSQQRGGTVDVLVTRTEDGLIADIRQSAYRWRREPLPASHDLPLASVVG